MKTVNTIGFILILVAATILSACDEEWYDDGYYTTSTYTETEYYEDEEVYYYDDEEEYEDLEIWPDYQKGSYRSFFGSYELNSYDSSCDDDGYYDPDLTLPEYIDVYEYGTDNMDFENMYGDLLWNTEVSSWYEFSFFTHAYDWYDELSIDFPCECSFVNVGEYDEYFECACDPSSTGETCLMYYDLM